MLLFWIPNILRCLKAMLMTDGMTGTRPGFIPPQRWLDVGCGPFSAAAAGLLHSQLTGQIPRSLEITGWDRSLEIPRQASELVRQWCELQGWPVPLFVFHGGDLESDERPQGPFQKVLACNLVNEFTGPRFLSELFSDLADTVFVLEPAKPDVFRRVMTLRKDLIARGLQVLAPCTHENSCPLMEMSGSWCWFDVALSPSLQWESWSRQIYGDQKRDLNFSFVVCSREEVIRKTSYRQISDEVPTRSGAGFYLCGEDGKHFVKHSRGRQPGLWFRGSLKMSTLNDGPLRAEHRGPQRISHVRPRRPQADRAEGFSDRTDGWRD